jgi:anthranilate phosphoribosyltransferase
MVGELKDGKIREYEIHPEDFGMTMMSSRNLRVADADESKSVLLGVLDNHPGAPPRDRHPQRRHGALYRKCGRFHRGRHRQGA